ncbi:hypothetical protein FPQ18DRAFT_21170 [Pyronema domesticum]|uniref:Cyclin N-terminal domain-containing protein n=1 Tax=Pyronema omphalodes (strain CBS 100304) TaxID=1076935 RepID=U4LH71_PYROM|nr:hypothetical protein FPQ18DRAFT_21170 [Pyronema domesticum]CCX30857.1 Similar to hypothetical protein [Tuber melanosporum Mel28]; acc. no. XP_002838015 [Pyronema omphalodes CBS 100304]
MPSRNIHSLSLSLADSEGQINTLNGSPRMTPPCSARPAQHLSTMIQRMENNTKGLGPTIFQQGLITPTTPSCYPGNTTTSKSNGDIELSSVTTVSNLTTISIPTVPMDIDTESAVAAMPTPESPADEDFDMSLEEFEKRYVPLSSLPTPPASSQPTISNLDKATHIDAEFLGATRLDFPLGWCDSLADMQAYYSGPARYLVSMVPRTASREPASIQCIADMLQRANLRASVVSLACCVLDCLSDQFLRKWRNECCRRNGYPEGAEVLVVAALAIAQKFFEDRPYYNKQWARSISDNLFDVETLSLTEILVLQDLNYDLMKLSDPELLEENLVEIRRFTEEACKASAAKIAKQQAAPVKADCSNGDYFARSSKTSFPLSGY